MRNIHSWPDSCFFSMLTVKVHLSERTVKARLRKIIFGPRTRCLKCNNFHVRMSNERYWCNKCRRFFSLTSSSWLKGIKFSFQTLVLLIHCWLKGYTVETTKDLTGLSRPTIYDWFNRFRLNAPQISQHFQGTCEIDETYIGPKSKRRFGSWKPYKVPVVGIYERESSQVKVRTMPQATLVHIWPFLKDSIHPDALSYSDKYRPYWPLKSKLGRNHIMVDHYAGEYSQTNHIEGFWSVMKRKIRRIYWRVYARNLDKYVCEIAYRFNTRNNPDKPLDFIEKSMRFQNTK